MPGIAGAAADSLEGRRPHAVGFLGCPWWSGWRSWRVSEWEIGSEQSKAKPYVAGKEKLFCPFSLILVSRRRRWATRLVQQLYYTRAFESVVRSKNLHPSTLTPTHSLSMMPTDKHGEWEREQQSGTNVPSWWMFDDSLIIKQREAKKEKKERKKERKYFLPPGNFHSSFRTSKSLYMYVYVCV